MDNENEQAQEEVVEQEEQTSEETVEETTEEQSEEESDSVTLSTKEFKTLNYKAKAYDATKEQKEVKTAKPSEKTDSSGLSYEAIFAVKDISKDEFESLKDEADSLGVPVEKYLKTESSKIFLKNIQNKKKSQDAKEPLNSKSPVFKKYTQGDLSKMSSAELEKILQE